MKFKCKACDKKFFSHVVFTQHSCMKAYNKAFPGDFFYLHSHLLEKVQDTMTHEQLLQKYNNAKNSAKSA